MKALVVFDLDGTLAQSKAALDDEMSRLLDALLGCVRVAVISGGDWPQFEKQMLSKLAHGERMKNLSVLPTCGAKFYTYDGRWKKLYAEDFSPDQTSRIKAAFDTALKQTGFAPERQWGDLIEDRGSQITFSALGQKAPLEAKKGWDPDFAKRKKIKAALDSLIPEFSVRLGGSTSIDVTRPGIDKGYGVRKLRDTLKIAIADMLFVGDAIFPGGNDYAAKEAGVESICVRDPDETKRVIEAVIACQKPQPEAAREIHG
jgi:HAD superfamily hydrolase (TIGR01484 family)